MMPVTTGMMMLSNSQVKTAPIAVKTGESTVSQSHVHAVPIAVVIAAHAS